MGLVLLLWVAGNVAMADVVRTLHLEEALFASDAGRQFQEEMRKEFTSQEEDLIALEKQAIAARDKVEQNQGLVTDQELQQLVLQFEKVYTEFQTRAETLQQRQVEKRNAFMNSMNPKLDTVVNQIIDRDGITVILPRNNLYFFAHEIDMTKEVIQLLNQNK